MSSVKDPYHYNKISILALLKNAFDRIEGQYSNIPTCCIEEFLYGSNYEDLKIELEDDNRKDLLKKLKKFHYVPCRNCLETKEPNELNLNGTSDVGVMLMGIYDIIKNKEKSDARKSNKKPKG